MVIERLKCTSCGVHLEGEMSLPTLARLDPEIREFIEVFVMAGGSLKEVGRVLGISYPTVRSRLDRAMAQLQQMHAKKEAERMKILEQLEKGEINAKEAIQLLKNGEYTPVT
jgi:hypothetical protein